ncbi:MAG: NADH-quinone oxidoreductase subunit C [Acidobacteriota bacterium]
MSEADNQDQTASQSGTPEVAIGANQTSRYADVSLLRTTFAAAIEAILEALGEVTIVVKRDGLLELLSFLKHDARFGFHMLSDLSGLDLGEFASPRFAINYHLYSIPLNHRLRVKLYLHEEDAHAPTVSGIWATANWHEREVYDMFGVVFDGHPDLRRILMPADYEGHPLRKDFPIKGY